MTSHFISHNNLELEYLTFGNGSTPLFAFHGFGRHADDYKVFETVFGKKYTLYAFNLFHHGNSKYPEERVEKDTFTKTEFTEIFKKFIAAKQITTFDVMGYSLGGKIALMFAELFPSYLTQVWLFAPDGIKMNFWYKVASGSKMGRSVYKYFLYNPQLFIQMVNGLHKTGIVNKKIKKFALKNMATQADRELVYKVWLTFKDTNPNIPLVLHNVTKYNLEVHQFFGATDQVIKPKLGKWFAKKLQQQNNLHILPTGHLLLTNKTAAYIQNLGII
jgi:pimeloyl-ACP methyl ester carboxylesterase